MQMIPGVTSIDNTKTIVKTAADEAMGKDDFLKLLIAQLAAQDPLDPMGAQDFSAQLAQFSALEQMTNVNTNLEAIQKLETALQNTSSVNLIGKTVESNGNVFNHVSGASDVLAFSLDRNAESIRIDIYDSSGKQIDLVKLGNQGQGKNTVSWNGNKSARKSSACRYLFLYSLGRRCFGHTHSSRYILFGSGYRRCIWRG